MIWIISLGIVWNVGLLFQALVSLHYHNQSKSTPQTNLNPDIFILIAVRDEELNLLNQCMEYFLSSKNISKLIICLSEVDNKHESYIQLIRRKKDDDNRLDYTCFRGKQGYKGDQLNVAIDQVLETNKETMFAIYDIDSRPDLNIFNFIKQSTISVGQQFTIYDLNNKNLSLFSLSGSLHQTFWSIGFEMFNRIFSNARLTYTIGHGLFVSSVIFKKYGLFEANCITEDIMFGYKLAIFQQPIETLPYFEHSQFAENLDSFIKQSSRWYSGELEISYRFFPWHAQSVKKNRNKTYFFFRVIEILWWPTERLIYIFCLLMATSNLININFAILYTLLLLIQGLISLHVTITGRWLKRYILASILVPIWHIVSVIGPILSIIKKVLRVTTTWSVSKK